MRAFGFDSYMDIAKLFTIPLRKDLKVHEDFWELAGRVTDNQELAIEAHKIFIEDGISDRNWGKYFNGKQARSKKKKKLNDAFDTLLPKAAKAFTHGKYNILSIIESSFVEEAIVHFATGLTDIHHDLEIKRRVRLKYSFQFERVIRVLERHGFEEEFLSMTSYDEIYRAAMICLRDGRFEAAFYLLYLSMPVLSDPSELDDERMLDFHILHLAAKVIKANYFSGGFEELAKEQNKTTDVSIPCENNKSSVFVRPEDEEQSFCLDYIENCYGIDKALWSSSYRIFEYSKDFWRPELSDRTQGSESDFTKRRYDSLDQWR